jgi:hypothetical protein
VHAQGDAQVGVGADGVVDAPLRALGGEDEVHPERTSPAGDVDQGVDEAGKLGDERGQLVDDDHQPGEGLGRAADGALVRDEIGGRGGAQGALPVADLGFEAAEHAGGQVLVEVGDHADDVGQHRARVEGAATLEVDEEQRARLRR